MLHEFITKHRGAILARTRERIAARPAPRATAEELERGIPLFLEQLVATLRAPSDPETVEAVATRHGADLLRQGFTVAQVVHDYGGVCQATTELADELRAPIAVDEFRTFNRCLDDAIAGAVTEYTRQRELRIEDAGRERLGELAHELRNALGAAVVSFEALRTGQVALDGSTAGVLGRSLRRISGLVDGSLAEVRLETRAGAQGSERASVRELIEELAVMASMQASALGLTLVVSPGDAGVDVKVDRQLIAAAIANLLQNAFKFTKPGSRVQLRASASDLRVSIEVEDECGGLPTGQADELFLPFHQRSTDRSGLGLGLSLSRKGVEANGGGLSARDMPGVGCVFCIDLPRLLPDTRVAPR